MLHRDGFDIVGLLSHGFELNLPSKKYMIAFYSLKYGV